MIFLNQPPHSAGISPTANSRSTTISPLCSRHNVLDITHSNEKLIPAVPANISEYRAPLAPEDPTTPATFCSKASKREERFCES